MSAAHLSGQTVHEAVEILVEDGRVQPVEQVVTLLLAVHEELEILVHSLLDGDSVLVSRQRLWSVYIFI